MASYSYQSLNVQFAPMLDTPWMIGICVIAFLLAITPMLRGKSPNLWIWRSLAAASLILALANPQILEEERIPQDDVALIIIDKSESQNFVNRNITTDEISDKLQQKLARIKNLEVRTTEITSHQQDETLIFQSIEQNLADIPKSRRAGTIIISDGQIHDVPLNDPNKFTEEYGPVHLILTGHKDEKDRHIQMIKTPAYGIIGQNVSVTFKVQNESASNTRQSSGFADVDVNINDETNYQITVPIGEEQTLSFPIEHAGQNIMSLKVSPLDGEITERNNQAAIIVNGLRDRLKVLLISGKPHMGERTWRNLLTSDPGTDLVHFTILRDPTKSNPVPNNELSLIPFPVRELFEVKLYDFDLIIFDRYKLSRIMPPHYFTNIAKYVYKGGALLVTSGPDFDGKNSIMTTDLEKIIPGKPTLRNFEKEFVPTLTDKGKIHPVTNDLKKNWQGDWGPWLWQSGVSAQYGHVLMTGHEDRPLLILERVGEGRVAQIASDQIWLWSKGYKGGGPQAELLRRLSHWLMKEPDLEEDALKLIASNDNLTIKRRNFNDDISEVEVITPSGKSNTITLNAPDNAGWANAVLPTIEQGIYRVGDGTQVRLAIIGNLITKELKAVVTSEEPMFDFASSSKSGIFWYKHDGLPDIDQIKSSDSQSYKSGRNWLGLVRNSDFTTASIKQYPLLPNWIFVLIISLLTCWAWWRESR